MSGRIRYKSLGLCGWPMVLLLAAPAHVRAAENFCFLQVSDLHISPQPAGSPDPFERNQSKPGLDWLCEEARKPQTINPANITMPPPAFILVTGDTCEYGSIAQTWDQVDRYFKPCGLPVYFTSGNHDNTWTSIVTLLQKRFGGDHYSFDRFGCHFACIDSATIQEPLPSIEQRTLTWLTKDLSSVPRGTPIFIFCHHPLSTTEFAQPYESLRLLEAIRGHNVVLLLMGHGHSARYERLGLLDSVMGGSTYGPDTGYNVISVKDNVLRVHYRYKDADKPMTSLLEKPLRPVSAPVLKWITPEDDKAVSGPALPISVRIDQPDELKLTVTIDKGDGVPLEPAANARGVFGKALPVGDLLPGAHVAIVYAQWQDKQIGYTRPFVYAPADGTTKGARFVLKAGSKAAPLLVDDQVIVATTDGKLISLTFDGPARQPRTLFDVQAAIIHAPALADKTLYFGASDQNVYAVNLAGKLVWKTALPGCAYGTPAVDDANVYVGDLEGYAHALDRKSGQLKWSQKHAAFSIEQPLILNQGVLYFGAWDGFVYAVNATDGTLKWRAQGPGGQSGDSRKKSRYYAPADCPGVVIGDRLFFCDRAYQLGSYSLDGKYLGDIAANIAAIGPTEDGRGFYARGLSEGLTRCDGTGKQLWSSPVAMGRFPAPPCEVAGKVFACSNRGVLSVHDAGDGKVLWKYQVTPGLHIMAPVAADRDGFGYVAGMDGSVTRAGSARPN